MAGERLQDYLADTAVLEAGTGITLTQAAPGDPVVVAATGGSGGGRTLLKETVLAANATTLSFTSADIPTSGYKNLVVELIGRSSAAATGDTVSIALNGDTTDANYNRQGLYGNNSSAVSTAADGVAGSRWLGAIAGASAAAGTAGVWEARILEFLGTAWHKVATCRAFSPGAPAYYHYAVRRKNAAAITSIDLTCGGQFVTGTIVRLYGEN